MPTEQIKVTTQAYALEAIASIRKIFTNEIQLECNAVIDNAEKSINNILSNNDLNDTEKNIQTDKFVSELFKTIYIILYVKAEASKHETNDFIEYHTRREECFFIQFQYDLLKSEQDCDEIALANASVDEKDSLSDELANPFDLSLEKVLEEADNDFFPITLEKYNLSSPVNQALFTGDEDEDKDDHIDPLKGFKLLYLLELQFDYPKIAKRFNLNKNKASIIDDIPVVPEQRNTNGQTTEILEEPNNLKSITSLPAYNLFHITTNTIKIMAGAIMGMAIGIVIGAICGGIIGAVCGGISGAFVGASIKPASSALKEKSHLLSNMGIWKVIDRKRQSFVKNMGSTLNVDMS
jgi:hypothetical protein